MSRVIRPIGPVSAALGRLGYRQYAAVFEDGKQVERVAILSTKEGDKLKFVGHYIDANGEVHTTTKMADMKRAARRIMSIKEGADEQQPAPKPAPKRKHTSKPTPQSAGAMIECKGCGKRHADDTLCPED